MPRHTQPDRQRIETALRGVRDPTIDTDADVVESGLVADVAVEGDAVRVEAGLSELDDGGRELVVREIRERIDALDGVSSVDVVPAGAPTATTDLDAFDRIIAVASAKGGVGKSTVATAIACAFAADEEVGLFDADLHGPNVPRLLDVSDPVRADDAGNPRPVEAGGDAASIEVMSAGLLGSETPLGWRGAMAHRAVSDLFADTAWAVDDTLVVDLPPGTGDVVLTTLQEVPVDGVVVVTTPFETSVVDTRRSVELFRDEGVPVLGAVVNMAAFTCPSCGDTHSLFGDGPSGLRTRVLAELPFDRTLQSTAEPGSVPDAVKELAATVRSEADDAWTVDPPEGTIDIRGTPAAERHERVRRAFASLAPGEPFYLLSDRDPSPVVEFLADLTDESTAALDVTVERRTPDDWLLSTTKP